MWTGRAFTLKLTTESSASSYGIPVLVDDDGCAYGTGDLVGVELEPETDEERAWLDGVREHTRHRLEAASLAVRELFKGIR